MRVLVVYAHPLETSFTAAIHRRVVSALESAGHEVDDCDLYAEGFDPCLSREERINYQNFPHNIAPVAREVARLRAAEALVLCFPVWNYGFPAILKGYIDRVFLPGVSFDLTEHGVVPRLRDIRRLVAVTTYGGSRLRAVLVGDPPRKLVTRMLRALVTGWSPVSYLALYDMDLSTPAVRERFLSRVTREMEKIR